MERSGPECIAIRFGITFRSLEFTHIFVWLSASRVIRVVRVMGHNSIPSLRTLSRGLKVLCLMMSYEKYGQSAKERHSEVYKFWW